MAHVTVTEESKVTRKVVILLDPDERPVLQGKPSRGRTPNPSARIESLIVSQLVIDEVPGRVVVKALAQYIKKDGSDAVRREFLEFQAVTPDYRLWGFDFEQAGPIANGLFARAIIDWEAQGW